MKTALITGINGFVGPYLADLLITQGYMVHGIDRWPTCPLETVTYRAVNILDNGEMTAAVSAVNPDMVFHLAGVSYLPEADASPGLAIQINIMGAVSVLDAVKNAAPKARLLMVGSSKEYDNTQQSDSIAETCRPNPTDFYGITKFVAELVGAQYHKQFGVDVCFTRSFNHTGRGQSPRFVCSDWARQSASIALGLSAPEMKVGSLDAQIDFSNVRDIVAGYFAILDKGQSGEAYNVCSGRAVPLEYILKYLTTKTGRTVSVQAEEKKKRAHVTSPRLVGDNSKLREHTGWKPEIPLEKTLDELFDYWMKELKKG